MQARSEVYVGHLGRRMTFLPGIPWLQIGHRVLPEPEIQVQTPDIGKPLALSVTNSVLFMAMVGQIRSFGSSDSTFVKTPS